MLNNLEIIHSLEIMWKGMLGLFLVSIFIMLIVIGIKRFVR